MKNSDVPHKRSIEKSMEIIDNIMSSLTYAPRKIGAGKHNKLRNTKKWKKHNKKHNKMRNTRRPKNLR